jgi:hypothetical protein
MSLLLLDIALSLIVVFVLLSIPGGLLLGFLLLWLYMMLYSYGAHAWRLLGIQLHIYTPLATLKMGQLLRDVFPSGVLNIISGGDEVGVALVQHPLVKKVLWWHRIAAIRTIQTRHIHPIGAHDQSRGIGGLKK